MRESVLLAMADESFGKDGQAFVLRWELRISLGCYRQGPGLLTSGQTKT